MDKVRAKDFLQEVFAALEDVSIPVDKVRASLHEQAQKTGCRRVSIPVDKVRAKVCLEGAEHLLVGFNPRG